MKQLIFKLMSRFDPGCETVSRTSSHSLDRPLTLKERLDLYLHFLVCSFCRRYHRQLVLMQKLASQVGSEDQSSEHQGPCLSPEAQERIKRAIDSSDNH